jgi:hypothetical protein
MKAALTTVALVALVAGCAHQGGSQAKTAGEETAIASALSGRIAGPPQTCVDLSSLGSNRSFGRNAIVFGSASDEVVYLNRPPAGCPELDASRALKTRTPTVQLCQGDVVTVFDPVSRVYFGSCALGTFTPYRRAHPAERK